MKSVGPTPNPQPGGPAFAVGVFLLLVTGSGYLKAEYSPFAAAAELPAVTSITGEYNNEDLKHMTSLAEPICWTERPFPAVTRRALVTLACLIKTYQFI